MAGIHEFLWDRAVSYTHLDVYKRQVLSGAGLGAAAWVFLAGQLFKVTDYKNCYRIFSCLVLVIGLLAVLLPVSYTHLSGSGWLLLLYEAFRQGHA